ncbi:MAG: DNA ligase D [Gammaproteobacteria bacterium]|nr:DNA ligase D [Gammaproteobacteria bacterium]
MAATTHDPLETYRTKRTADRSPEPFGRTWRGKGHLFVVQHHAARRLHYDFRLELGGVLLSWAVPKGPSPNPADKRLAVQVEDHPLEYAAFEGVIPEGNYGAGGVIVWDRGTWLPIGDPAEGLDTGKLLFELRGYKLRGRWTLVKTRKSPKDWLLIKETDGYVLDGGTADLPADSILSGLTAEVIKARHNPAKQIAGKLKRLRVPASAVSPTRTRVMLAQSGKPFTKAGWIFEVKFDGYRLLAGRTDNSVTLYSRAGNDLTATFPEIADVVRALPFDQLVIDGEAVVHDEEGRPDFGRMQKRGRLTRREDIERATVDLPVTFYAFDVLGLEGHDLRALPLTKRKQLLRDILPSVGPIRYSEHVKTHGEALYRQAQHLKLEGILAKKSDAAYRAGRSPDWIKISLDKTDDFVIVGYTDPKGTQPEFGALLLAQYEGDTLVYAGRAGTGFTRAEQRAIGEQLQRASATKPPRGAEMDSDTHWVKPDLVCEVRFKNVTSDGVLRAPVFVRLREDKGPEDCVRETIELELAGPPPAPSSTEKDVHLTNLDKVFWPDEGLTKGDLIAYYRAISKWLLPYLKDRPVVLVRHPEGIEGKSFFQKDAPAFAPDWIRIERIWSEHAAREVRYFIVDDVETLTYIINLGTIPLHIWSSRMATLERPDWCILDLDPKGAPFPHVLKIANAIRRLCKAIELPCFLKTSGSTGLHILIPLGQTYTYEQSRTLGELLANVIVHDLPDIATVNRRLGDREGRVYIDYLQNGHGRLLVAPYSARPLPAAPVSMPLNWSEARAGLSPTKFTIKSAIRRMGSLKADPLESLLTLKPDLFAALEKLSRRLRS